MNLKRFLPQASAIVIFFIVTAVFFNPLFHGKQIRQGDVVQSDGASKEIRDYRAKTGKEALWTNSMFGGMPAYQISVAYPNNLMRFVQNFFLNLLPSPAPIVLIGMIGFYFLLITFKVDPWLSIGGAVGYGLSSYLMVIIQAGHNSQAVAIAYMAPVLMGVIMTMRGRLLLGGALTALSLALELYSNHLQVTYYLMILLLFVVAGETVRLVRAGEMRYLIRAGAILAAATIIALLPNITNILLTKEYGKYSTRGKSDITIDNDQQTKTDGLPIEYATQWSYGEGETFTLMIPDISGGASEAIENYDKKALDDVDQNFKDYIGKGQSAYFGGQPFTGGPVYAGAIACFLFILGLFIIKDTIKWWLLGATVLSIILAWGHNVPGITAFFFNHFPGYNKFRAVYMILVIAQLTIPLMAMLTLREIITNTEEVKAKMRMFYIAFALTGGIALLIGLTPSSFVTVTGQDDVNRITQDVQSQGGSKQVVDEVLMNLETARLAIVKSDALRSFAFILLAAGLIFFYVRKPFSLPAFIIPMVLLFLIDMWGVGRRYLNDDNYEKERKAVAAEIPPSPADQMILKDPSPDYRVLNVATQTWQDARTSYYHKSIGGYHGAKLKRIQELYEQEMEKEVMGVRSALQAGGNDSSLRAVLSRVPALNMLNAKYIIYNPDGGVLTNRYACGNAWFVHDVKLVANADEEIQAIPKLAPKMTAVADKVFEKQLDGFQPRYDSTASIKLVSYEPNDLKYESKAASEQVAVFSEIYYDKGWNAYIDGKEAPYFRADFTLRAMRIPAGNHEVEFKFEPSSYYTGEKIALAGSILLFLCIGGAIYFDWKKRTENEQQAA